MIKRMDEWGEASHDQAWLPKMIRTGLTEGFLYIEMSQFSLYDSEGEVDSDVVDDYMLPIMLRLDTHAVDFIELLALTIKRSGDKTAMTQLSDALTRLEI